MQIFNEIIINNLAKHHEHEVHVLLLLSTKFIKLVGMNLLADPPWHMGHMFDIFAKLSLRGFSRKNVQLAFAHIDIKLRTVQTCVLPAAG